MRWWRSALARLGARTPFGRDVATAALLAVVLSAVRIVVTVLVTARQPDPQEVTVPAVLAGTLVTVLDCAAIAFRRRLPRTALAAATALVIACVAIGPVYAEPGIGLVVCAYTVASLLPRRPAVALLAAAAAAHAAGGILLSAAGGELASLITYWGVPGEDRSAVVIASVSSVGIAGLIGAYVQTRRAHLAELVARAERLEAERDDRDRRAAADERGRIARELHDIAAHDLSAIVVQAGAADRLVDRDPDAAKETLYAIRRQGRDTLTSLRRLVGILREDDAGGRAPPPTLRRLDELVAGARAAGLPVELAMPPVPALPAAVDLAAYRVVQEALTNALRHAPGAAVSVRVAFGATVVVTVTNGPGADARDADARDAEAAGGNGLAGMRERVRLAGGSLVAGPVADGGWMVEARLPAGGSAAADTMPG